MEVVALSGGKDSTALALRLAELEPNPDREYLITPTGDELPEMQEHWARLETMLGKPMTRVTGNTLEGLIEHFGALPNWRQRWCTRMLKIQPCLAWIRAQQERVTLCVGLRADEPERKGIYSEDVDTRFPLREWGWGIREVVDYLKEQGVKIPQRTDCARCYGQRLSEWWELWKTHPDLYLDAERQEQEIGHTFRSPARDTWPAELAEMRVLFEAGRTPRGAKLQLTLLEDEDDDEIDVGCRICRM